MVAVDDGLSCLFINSPQFFFVSRRIEIVILDQHYIYVILHNIPHPIGLGPRILYFIAKNQMIGVVFPDGIVVSLEISVNDFCIHKCLIGKTPFGIFGHTVLAYFEKILPRIHI